MSLALPSVRSTRRPAARASLAAGLLTWAMFSTAADIHVPADQPTIQVGINAAADGDRVLVAPGVYDESIDFLGKDIQVIATEGPRQTTIDAIGHAHAVLFKSGEPASAALKGFQIYLAGFPQNPADPSRFRIAEFGGAILISGTSAPEISGNYLQSNRACYGGGIAAVDDARPLIHDNFVAYNYAGSCGDSAGGGGIYVSSRARVVVEHNRIYGNSVRFSFGGGIYVAGDKRAHSNTIVARNSIIDNIADVGGGMYVTADHVRIVDNLFNYNSGNEGAGIFMVATGGQSHPVIVNNTFVDDQRGSNIYTPEIGAYSDSGGHIGIINNVVVNHNGLDGVDCNGDLVIPPVLYDNLVYTPGATTQTYCNVQGTLLTVDPQFVGNGRGKGSHPFWLRPTSPAIDAGDSAATKGNRLDLTGAPRISGVAVDLGAIEFRQK